MRIDHLLVTRPLAMQAHLPIAPFVLAALLFVVVRRGREMPPATA